MSMISEQVKELREMGIRQRNNAKVSGKVFFEIENALSEAANIIEALSAKLEKANMERKSAYYGSGWIVCEDRLPEIMRPVFVCDRQGNVCVRAITCEIKGKKYWSQGKCDIVAWQPLPEPYKQQ